MDLINQSYSTFSSLTYRFIHITFSDLFLLKNVSLLPNLMKFSYNRKAIIIEPYYIIAVNIILK